ncbi:MAG: DUF4351 domain-containing protein [Blastocatellia bacterium]
MPRKLSATETVQLPSATSDQDSAWKEMLDEYLRAFLKFFFPQIHEEIDWRRGYESLDKELAQIRPAHAAGKLFADKLFKVFLKNGKPAWLLIHIEVQDRIVRGFARRLFVYNYRLQDKHGVEVVSLTIITGSGRAATGRYKTSRWNCSTVFEFPVVRIAEFAGRWDELEASDNVFAIAVMAQLKAMETKGDNERRLAWKRRLLFDLYRRKFSRAQIINLFRFFDWVMALPPELEEKLRQDVYEFEEKNKMPYVTSFERFAKQEGLEQGKRTMTLHLLQLQVGELTDRLQKRLSRLSIEQIEQLAGALLKFKSKADLLAWLKSQTITSRPKAATNGGAHAKSS